MAWFRRGNWFARMSKWTSCSAAALSLRTSRSREPFPIGLIQGDASYVVEGVAGQKRPLPVNPSGCVLHGVEDAAAGA